MKLRELSEICQKINVPFNKHPKIFMLILMVIVVLFLIIIPPIQVSLWNINNATTNANLENKFRLTMAQIIGGVAVFATLYYTGENLKVAREGQMAERFTKATIQLKNKNEEIRLGAIYTLGSIWDKYDETYWPIMEILTNFVRDKTKIDTKGANNIETKDTNSLNKISLDVQTVLTVFGKRKSHKFEASDSPDLQYTYLRKAQLEQDYFKGANFKGADLEESNLRYIDLEGAKLMEADFKGADFEKANLESAHLEKADLEKANFEKTNLEKAYLYMANLTGTDLRMANLKGSDLRMAKLVGANLEKANLERTDLRMANLEGANLEKANLEGANLEEANLMRAKELTFNQLSKVKTLYHAKLEDKSLCKKLKEKYPTLFIEPNDLEFLRK
jgi:uncharacterized protein YjbI with pentapeptide repeats